MKCETCPAPVGTCLGESVPRLCDLASSREDYRRHLARLAEGEAGEPSGRTFTIEAVLSRVSACPDRGQVLPPGEQPECGCSERTECRAGRGVPSGSVTLPDCLACVARAG